MGRIRSGRGYLFGRAAKAFEVTHLTPVPEDFLSAAPQEPEEGFYEEYDDFPEDDGCMDGYWND